MRWVHKKKQNSHWYCLKWCSSSHVIQDKEKIRRVVSQSDLSLWWRLHHVVLFTELSAQIGEWVYDFRHCLALQLASPAPSENIHRIEKKPLIEVHHCKNDADLKVCITISLLLCSNACSTNNKIQKVFKFIFLGRCKETTTQFFYLTTFPWFRKK